jgi:hypothetical protein
MYNRLPEDDPSGSKHVEDKKNIKNYNTDLEKVVGLYCTIILKCTVQKPYNYIPIYGQVSQVSSSQVFPLKPLPHTCYP